MSWKEDLKYYKSFTVTISGWSFYYIGFAGYTFLVQFLWGYTNLLEHSNVFLYKSVTFTDAY